MRDKFLRLGMFLGVSIFLAGGCVPGTANPSMAEPVNTASINQTISGTILASGANAGEWTVQTAAGPVTVHDGNVSLAAYFGQQVKLTGQYSGTTLYVDLVEPVQ